MENEIIGYLRRVYPGKLQQYLCKKEEMNYQMDTGMNHNQNVLRWLSDVGGDGKSYRQDNRSLDFKLIEGEIYAFYTPDSDLYFRTVFLKKMGIDQVLKPVISQFPTYGVIPPHIQEIKPQQIYQYMRMHNMSNMNGVNAFPKTDVPKRSGY